MNCNDAFLHPEGLTLANRLISALRKKDFIEAIYPSLFSYGIPEGSLHAHMLSGLLILGEKLGFSPVCDAPIFNELDNLLLGEGSKRPDSIWYERGSSAIRMLVEFERYQGNAISQKTRNLLIMANACRGELSLITLIYWTDQIRSLADLQSACYVIEQGFTQNGNRFKPPNCPFLLLESCVGRSKQGIFLTSFIARKFIYDGENKPYIVNQLNAI
jgi:hypothetical protein